jgi:SNF2 family DNA or RNA helicase
MFKEFLKENNLEEHPHQVDGVEWCLKKENEGVTFLQDEPIHGGIIADEMGLGKTIQLVGIMNSNKLLHTLIVLPKALLPQWIQVIKKTLKQKPLIYHGIWKNKSTLDHLYSYRVVITTYGMIAMKNKKNTSLLHKVKWDRIIFDEAHHMRNNKTNIYQGASHLKSKIKWLVTGTPIQNKRSDLYSLCALLRLPTLYFTSPANLPNLCENFILQRTKKSTGLTLPKLNIQTINIPWSNESEYNLSEDIHASFKFSNISKELEVIETPTCLLGECSLVALLRARQICILPHLLRNKYEKYIKTEIIPPEEDNIIEAIQSSSKMDVVIKTILNRSKNRKAKIIFCHYRGEIDYIKNILSVNGLNVESFDGRTNEKQRYAILTNKKLDALILQIQTGCEGLNLQQFSEVYFISPHWNPAVEDQAIARCHRFGQKEDVEVFRFNMIGFEMDTITIDEYSSSIQQKKRNA